MIAALPDDEARLGPLCRAALAAELLHQPGVAERSVRLAEDAMADARRLGDPALLGDVCALAQLALVRPDLKARSVALADEVIGLRQRTADEAGLAAALTRRSDHRVEIGQWEEAIADALRAREIAERLHLAPTLMVTELRMAVVAQAHGRWEEAARALDSAEAIHAMASISGHGMAGALRALMRMVTGGLGDLEGCCAAACTTTRCCATCTRWRCSTSAATRTPGPPWAPGRTRTPCPGTTCGWAGPCCAATSGACSATRRRSLTSGGSSSRTATGWRSPSSCSAASGTRRPSWRWRRATWPRPPATARRPSRPTSGSAGRPGWSAPAPCWTGSGAAPDQR